jgi:hypothetical protein
MKLSTLSLLLSVVATTQAFHGVPSSSIRSNSALNVASMEPEVVAMFDGARTKRTREVSMNCWYWGVQSSHFQKSI